MKKLTKREEIDIKQAEYSNRIQFWSSQSIGQLSFSINFFVTLGVGFLAFLVSKEDYISLIGSDFDLSKIPLLIIFLSITLGCISTLSRLKDLRLTRAVVLVRKRTIKKLDSLLADDPGQTSSLSFSWIPALLCKNKAITKTDFDNPEELQKKFNKLRYRSGVLGAFTWITHKLQIISFALAILSYIVLPRLV